MEAAERSPLKRVSKGKRPQYFRDPATDKLFSMVLVLSQELSVAIERIDTLESILADDGVVPRDRIENYTPNDESSQRRAASRELMIKRLFRTHQADIDAVLARADEGVDEALS